MDINILKISDVENIRKEYNRSVLLDEDAVCIACGTIFNSHFRHECITCGGDNTNKDDYIVGKLSVNLRLLLNFNIIDLRALCDIHGCSVGSRAKMVLKILNSIYPNLDKRVTENLIRKIIFRNKKKFYFIRDIDAAMNSIRAKKIDINKVDKKRLVFIDSNKILDFIDSNKILDFIE